MKRIKVKSFEKILVGMVLGMAFLGFIGRVWVPDISILGILLENLIILGIAYGVVALCLISKKIVAPYLN